MDEALTVLRRDAQFAPLIRRVGPIELRSRRPYFWLLCRAVIAQQVSGAAARSISGRVSAHYPERRHPDAASILATPAEALRSAGLSRQKTRYLYALAEAFATGPLAGVRFSHLDDDAIVERLTRIVGIGRWTAEMFLIFSMRRPDIFPIDDLGIRRGMERIFEARDVGAAVERAEVWRPYRTVSSLYLWRAVSDAAPA